MIYSFTKGLGILAISSLLAAGCQSEKPALSEQEPKNESTEAAREPQESATASEKHSHDHSHAHSEESQKIYDGFFENSQVKDRPLSDWSGDWQSVYPYLQSGELDEVFEDKAFHSDNMTAEKYKEYYTKGYQTEVDRVVIKDDVVTFYKNGEPISGRYTYDGYEILTYEAGNRGVRFVFALAEKVEGLPQFIQFSDHAIFPTDASHYHLYWGDDRSALLEEVENWPTYYPSDMDGHSIAHEMIAH